MAILFSAPRDDFKIGDVTAMKMSMALSGYWLDNETRFSEHTKSDYGLTFRRFVERVGDKELSEFTPLDVREFLAHLSKDLKLGGKTCANAWIALSSFWSWAESNLDAGHVVRKVPQPKYKVPAVDAYTQAEIKAMIAGCEHNEEWTSKHGKQVKPPRSSVLRDKAIIVTLVDTGIRASELCNLEFRDYSEKTGRIDIRGGKGDKDRVVYASTSARRYIWRYLASRKETKPSEPLFVTATANPLDRRGLLRMIATLGKRVGVDNAYVHKFRHTFAVNFVRNGGNPIELKNLLGHSNMNTVLIYVRLAAVDLQNAQQRASVADKWRL